VKRASVGGRLLLLPAVAGALVWAVIVDLGVSAGRIHHGVSVAGVDVGGLTESQAAAALSRRVRLLLSEPVVFTAAGLEVEMEPACVAWRPKADRSAAQAMRVGRDHAPLGAFRDRWRGWFGGVRLRWFGRPGPRRR
jgi:hypothetical protein